MTGLELSCFLSQSAAFASADLSFFHLSSEKPKQNIVPLFQYPSASCLRSMAPGFFHREPSMEYAVLVLHIFFLIHNSWAPACE